MTLTVKNVCKSFGDSPLLKDISFTLKPGMTLCVTGPSGSGKTVLLRIVMGLEQPDSGEVSWSGGVTPRLGVMFQEDRLFDGLDAVENLRLTTGEKDREALTDALRQLLPEEALGRRVSTLSGGQRRRVALVRALRPGGEAVLLDEPFAGLDAEAAAHAGDYIRRELKERPLLLALHRKEIPDWCDNIIVLSAEADAPANKKQVQI